MDPFIYLLIKAHNDSLRVSKTCSYEKADNIMLEKISVSNIMQEQLFSSMCLGAHGNEVVPDNSAHQEYLGLMTPSFFDNFGI